MAKKSIIRGGQKLLGTLGNGTGEDILTISADKTFNKISSGTPATYLTNALTSAYLLVGSVSDVATPRAITGDVLISNTGVTSIASGVIVNDDIAGGAAIAYSKLALTNSIVNADIATAANITRSKLAAGTAYRLVANDISGVMSENPAITANMALISNANGLVIASAVTNSELNFLAGASANIQNQLDTNIVGLPTNALVQNPTASEDFWAIMWDNANQEWILSDPILQGLPVGGTTNQFLKKVDNTNYNVTWDTLTLSDITDITATAADVNLLGGLAALGITTTELFYLDGLSGNIQSQLGTKMSNALVQNAIWVGNASNVAAGEVLTADSLEASGLKWDTGGGAGLVDADYGDITVSGAGTVMTIDTDINKSWTGNHTFLDSGFRVADNADPTKLLALQLSGLTAATTRTLTIPDLSGTVALLGASGNGAALTNVDDTNVTLTIDAGGATALLTATELTLGWTGQLSVARGGTNANNAADARTNLGAVGLTGNETIAGIKTFSSDPIIPDEVYGVAWNGSLEPPTKNAVYDKVEVIAPIHTEYMFTSSLLAFDQDLWLVDTTITKIVKSLGVATLSYTKNGGASTSVTFNATTIVANDTSNATIAVTAGDIFVWTITYTGGYTSSSFTVVHSRT